MPIKLLAVLALLPAMTGPLPRGEAHAITIDLCQGGSLTIPLSGTPAEPERPALCCEKGCHGGSTRKRIDRSQ